MASTYDAAQAGSPVAVLWADYQEGLAPPWLRNGAGLGWLRAMGDVKDELELRAKDAIKLRHPQLAPVDALGLLSSERGLFQGPTETNAAFRSRLQAAFSVWPWAGTATGLLRALYYAGYPNTGLITGGGNVHTLDSSQNVVNSVVTGGFALGTGFWNGFTVVFFPSWPASWAGVPPSNTSNEVNFIRALVNQWRPGHALLESMIAITLPVWGWPATQLWGSGTWGNATPTTTWTP
jgi:hypothetical protein